MDKSMVLYKELWNFDLRRKKGRLLRLSKEKNLTKKQNKQNN